MRECLDAGRQEQEAEREVRLLRLLAGVAGDLLRTTNPTKVIRELVGRVLPSLECEVFFNFLMDEEKPGVMRLNAWEGFSEETAREIGELPLGVAVCGKVALRRRAEALERVTETTGEETALLRELEVRSYACFPLMAGEEVLGTLGFGSRVLERFSDSDRRVMGLVAEHIALALERERSVRREREVQLRVREAEWRQEQIMRHAPMAVFMKDLEGRYVYCNPPELEWIGREAGEVIGRTDFELFPEEQARRFRETDRVALERHEPLDLDVSAEERPDGRGLGRAHSVVKFALRDSEGRAFAVCGIALDVTPRVRAERSAKEALERLSLAQLGGRTGFFDWWPGEDRVIWSAELETLYGLEPGTFEGRIEGWVRRVHPEDIGGAMASIRGAIEAGRETTEFQFRAIRPDGSEVWLLGKALIVYDARERGRAVRVIGMNVDITESKETEGELREARREAERARDMAMEANLAKDRFLTVLSHELRTPLTPVLATAQLMEKDLGLKGHEREAWGMVRRNVALEARLIDDLLDLTRIARGKVELQMSRVDAHEKALEVCRICERDVAEKGVGLQLELRARRSALEADGARIQQVLWNLLKNAIKFTPGGGVITVRSYNEGCGGGMERLVLEVEDSGIGISVEAMSRIFDAFEQADSAIGRQFGGLGLGLSISKALVERHGGTIEALSQGVGKGSIFRIRLPLGARVEEGRVGDAGGSMGGSWGGSMGVGKGARLGVRVLLVDDHVDTLRAMSRLLRAMGYEVRTADCVESGVEAWRSEPADVLVSDLGLPDGTGCDLLRRLLAEGEVRAIAVSGFGMEQDMEESREAGFRGHLIKPVDIRRLDEAIQSLVGVGREGPV